MKRSRMLEWTGVVGLAVILIAAVGCGGKKTPEKPEVSDRITGETAPAKLDVGLEAAVPQTALVRSVSHDARGQLRAGDTVNFTVDAVVPDGYNLKVQVVETNWSVASARALGNNRYTLRSQIPQGVPGGSYRVRASIVDANGVEVAAALGDGTLAIVEIPACAVIQQQLDNLIVYYDFDDSSLRPDALATLDRIASVLKQVGERFTLQIGGHTDERGTAEYNLALSERRARSARDRLVSLGVISADRVELIPYGEERPVDSRHTEEAWARNRRADVKIICP